MNAKQAWQAALGELQMKVPGPSFQTWLKNTSIAQFEEGKSVAIAVPSNFAKEWLEKRYSKQIAETLHNVLGYAVEVRF
jgi:chromosomal replication initiator protein